MSAEYLDFHPEVRAAIDSGRPVVALESTIIAHGMPFPGNVETAKKVESIIREEGVVPATIGILEGRLKIGLEMGELEWMGSGDGILKASRRDLPFLLAKRLNGATTVASTVFAASLAGIRIMVTGGIGGVHRGAGKTFDVSADLMELAQTDVAVLCAGAKSILDIGPTLEYLETHGVPVAGLRTAEFPAFYLRESGFPVDFRADSEAELARIMKIKWDLGLKGGIVIGNPIPKEAEMDRALIGHAIDQALREAREKGVRGKEETPFLLSRIEKATDGESLKANRALVFHNAAAGARLAAAYAKLV